MENSYYLRGTRVLVAQAMVPTAPEALEDPEQPRTTRLVNGNVEVPSGMSRREFKRKLKAEKRVAEHDDWVAARREKRKLLKKRKRQRVSDAAAKNPQPRVAPEHSGVKVILDCAFDDYMKEGEITSLARQITRCYSENRKTQHPVDMHISSMNKRLLEIFTENQHGQFRNWKPHFSYSDHDFENTDTTIYLSSDSDTVLETLEPGFTYVIGGVVDKGRHKDLCKNKAEGKDIKTARLPIDEHIKLSGRRVLATNHVFELILKYLELKDWKAAFEATLPERKLNSEKQESHASDSSSESNK